LRPLVAASPSIDLLEDLERRLRGLAKTA